MGKEGSAKLKRRIGCFFNNYGPPERVSHARYRVGLLMFSLPLLLAWLGPYIGQHLPGYDSYWLAWAITGDAFFVASFFVLGGGFWNKLRALFVHSARAVFSATESDQGAKNE